MSPNVNDDLNSLKFTLYEKEKRVVLHSDEWQHFFSRLKLENSIFM